MAKKNSQPLRDNFNRNLTDLRISLTDQCNFRCGYCMPKASSAYFKEIEKFGPYDMVTNHRQDIDWLKIYEEDTNPYVKAWWKWWPEVSKTLTILRITGGEPTMSDSVWGLFDLVYCREHVPLLFRQSHSFSIA